MDTKRVIEINNLRVSYKNISKEKTALKGISFTVPKGEIFGFLGPNGAGKTTTIKTILGLIPPSSGIVRLFQKAPSDPSARALVGFMPETANYYGYLTPKELLLYYGRLFGIKKTILLKRADELLDFVGLKEEKNHLLKTFSKGMLQKVSFAQSLINDPQLLVLDEPTTGLDPISKMKMRDYIQKLKKENKTVFFSSHELSEVEIICDEVAILTNGEIIKRGNPKQLISEKGEHITLEKFFFDIVKEK